MVAQHPFAMLIQFTASRSRLMVVPMRAKAARFWLCRVAIQKPQITGNVKAILPMMVRLRPGFPAPENDATSNLDIAGANAAVQKRASDNGRIGSR